MKDNISIYFDNPLPFELGKINQLSGITGLYFIFSKKVKIQYPYKESRLLYIGMSEKKTNSIRNRLSDHFDGKSKNIGLSNYRKSDSLLFTYLNYEIIKNNWNLRIEDLESYFILDFVKYFGVYPICNNKTGFEVLKNELLFNINIDWNYFN
ncbi:MAG: hypothetical protein WAT71_00425 [Ignavibacteria bacterium]